MNQPDLVLRFIERCEAGASAEVLQREFRTAMGNRVHGRGDKDFAAVINPPHATILAVGAGEERAVVRKGKVEVATVMTVTLSTDHRAVDGALGAQLLSAFKALIEHPAGMLA